MLSKYSTNPDLKGIISHVINNKNQVVKGHSDSINCLINCVDYKFILQVIQNPNNGKNNSFFIIEKDNFYTPLFFYDYPSNEIIDLIEKKSDAKKLFICSKKIKSEEEIIDDYKQFKKNKILLFSHLKFPLTNANSENNVNRNCTIIILDEGKNDIISNFSINSYSNTNQNCSILFDIHNLKCANYLFSLEDIKDCQEIKFKFNGNVHGQKLFKEDAVSSISPDLIINSIKTKMQKFVNLTMKKAKKAIYNKFFFTKLNNNNCNNIGILFSFKGNKDTQTKSVNKYVMEGKYEINKIFICIDMWMDNNNIRDTKDSSNNSSNISNIYINTEENYYFTNINSHDYQNNSYKYNYYNNKYNDNNNKFNDNNNKYNDNNNKYNDNNNIYNNKYNNYNNKYNGDSIFNNNNFNYNNNKYKENKFDNLGEEQSKYNKNNSYENFKTYKETTYSSYNKFPKIENKYDNQNYYNNSNNLSPNYENNDYNQQISNINNFYSSKVNEQIYMYKESNEQNYQIYNDNFEQNKYNEKNPDEGNNKIKENPDKTTTLKSLKVNLNNEFIEKIFEEYKQDYCISNYTILRNKIDLNISVDMEKLKNVKLLYFFDCFKDINRLSLDIPFINIKGKLLINEFNPTLSSMRLILKTSKKTAKKIKKNKKENFIIKTIKPNLLKIEYGEIKAPFDRDILYKKVVEIEEILGDNKIAFKHVLQEKSYFCVLWTNKNTHIINTSFLAYYSFELKLIGVLMIKLNSEPWLSSFSYNTNYYKDYQIEYDKNVKNIIEYFNNLSLEKGDYYQNFYTADYRSYVLSQKQQSKE